jgi:hypothetical protein
MITAILGASMLDPSYKGVRHLARSVRYEDRFVIPVADTSPGIQHNAFPQTNSKKQEYVQAQLMLEDGAVRGKGELVVLKVCGKSEVSKKGKDGRNIYVDHTASYLAVQGAFGELIHSKKNPYLGYMSSLKLAGNTAMVMFDRLTSSAANYDEARSMLYQGYSEMDAKAWDLHMSPLAKMLYVVSLSSQTLIDNYWVPQLTQSLACFICPLVAVAPGKCIEAPNLVPSGMAITLLANTGVHQLYISSFVAEVIRGGDPDWPELKKFCSYLIQGDDFLCPANKYAEQYREFRDRVWGTHTTGGTTTDGEICRRHLDLDEMVIRKDPSRVLGKLYHYRGSNTSFLQALCSASKEANHPEVTRICKLAYEKIQPLAPRYSGVEYEPGMKHGTAFLNWEVVRAFHLPDSDIMLDMAQERDCAKYGCSLAVLRSMFEK